MSKLQGLRFAQELCEAMGLDPGNVVKLNILCDMDMPAIAEISILIEDTQGKGIKSVLERYLVSQNTTEDGPC